MAWQQGLQTDERWTARLDCCVLQSTNLLSLPASHQPCCICAMLSSKIAAVMHGCLWCLLLKHLGCKGARGECALLAMNSVEVRTYGALGTLTLDFCLTEHADVSVIARMYLLYSVVTASRTAMAVTGHERSLQI